MSAHKRATRFLPQHIFSAASSKSAEMALTFGVLLLLCGFGGLMVSANKCKEPSCPDGWYLLNDRCFIFVQQQRIFSDAEQVCILKGGNLASIRNALENELVMAIIAEAGFAASSTWIGFSDAITEDVFLWTDGSPFKFEDFAAIQPDNFGGTEDCGEINSTNQWNDDDCTDLNNFVCSKDASCKH
ncbi:galactose-specific lectin nattectin-like [Nerophis lumbriciformis]|uniref:galactose-specific lectin nattectin-like n=1 Tax=Nerophis lumbriciformis TaxID=546530 RepID=UPI002ADF3CD9|nr:galactose-specific lectin nattectin-like [Nerophis lumbriciformis]